jgi:hypothetical protein
VHKDTKPLDPTRARKPPRPQSRGDAYGQAAKIVAAVRDKSAGDKAGNVLFDPDQLNEALVSIGAPTSRVRRSHDEVITEIDNNLLLAKERLAKVEALKANAHLIRGAVRIPTKPDMVSDRSRTAIRRKPDSDPKESGQQLDEAGHRRPSTCG